MDEGTTQASRPAGTPERVLAEAVCAGRSGDSLAVRRTDDDTLVALFRRRSTTIQVRVMNLGPLPPHVPAGCPCQVPTCGRTRAAGAGGVERVGGIGCRRHAGDWCAWLVALHRRRRPGEDLWLTAVSRGSTARTTLLPMEGASPRVAAAAAPSAQVPRQVRPPETPACLAMAPTVRVSPPREKPRDERYYLWGWATDSK